MMKLKKKLFHIRNSNKKQGHIRKRKQLKDYFENLKGLVHKLRRREKIRKKKATDAKLDWPYASLYHGGSPEERKNK